MGQQMELRAKERNEIQAKLLAEYEINGGNLTLACRAIGIAVSTHTKWMGKYTKYAAQYNAAREKTRMAKVQKCEDIGNALLDMALAQGVENLSRDQLHEVRAEAEFQRRTLASDQYSTKERHIVQDETGRPTWDDVMATIKGASVESEGEEDGE